MMLSHKILYRFVFFFLFLLSWAASLAVIFSAPDSKQYHTDNSVETKSKGAFTEVRSNSSSPRTMLLTIAKLPQTDSIENLRVRKSRQSLVEIDPKNLAQSETTHEGESLRYLVHSTAEQSESGNVLTASSARSPRLAKCRIIMILALASVILLVKARLRTMRHDRYLDFIQEKLAKEEIVSEFTYVPASSEIGYGSFMPRTWLENEDKFDV